MSISSVSTLTHMSLYQHHTDNAQSHRHHSRHAFGSNPEISQKVDSTLAAIQAGLISSAGISLTA